MAAGLISSDEFTASIQRFINHTAIKDKSWIIQKMSNSGEYLVKRIENHVLTKKLKDDECDAPDMIIEEDDPECLTSSLNDTTDLVTFEYHVIYSPSYSVPVLYFNIYKSDGRLLSLEEVWNVVPEFYKERLEHERWTFITQQEHPILHRPFFQLHPCHTADLMKNFPTNEQSDYLITWLSSVGPVVGLTIPLHYGTSMESTIQTSIQKSE